MINRVAQFLPLQIGLLSDLCRHQISIRAVQLSQAEPMSPEVAPDIESEFEQLVETFSILQRLIWRILDSEGVSSECAIVTAMDEKFYDVVMTLAKMPLDDAVMAVMGTASVSVQDVEKVDVLLTSLQETAHRATEVSESDIQDLAQALTPVLPQNNDKEVEAKRATETAKELGAFPIWTNKDDGYTN